MAMFSGSHKDGEVELSAETFIGPSVKLEGTFSAEGDVVVDGVLVGSLSTSGDVRVGPQATIDAQIHANNAHVAGNVKGNITVTGALRLAGTATIHGDIKTASLAVEEGAVMQGKVSMSRDKSAKTSKREAAHTEKARDEKQEGEHND